MNTSPVITPTQCSEAVRLPPCLQAARGNIGIGVPDDKTGGFDALTALVSGYEGEGYMVMTSDRARVNAFKSAIRDAVKHKCRRWVEIGPGAHGVLTRLVLEAAPDTTIRTIEGNPNASRRVQSLLKDMFPSSRWSVVQALTSEPLGSVELHKHQHCDAVLSEVLGMIMSAEYVVDIMAEVHAAGLIKQVFLPRWGATFYTPVTLHARKHLRASLILPRREGVGVALSPDGHWLHARRVPLHEAATFRHPDGTPQAGCLELVDFGAPLDEQRLQTRITSFSSFSSQTVVVDGLGLWIWAGFDHGSQTRTAFPYGCAPFPGMPAATEVKAALSSYAGEPDRDVYAYSWRNVVMLFQPPLTISPDSLLRITSTCNLEKRYQPSYSFEAELCNAEGQTTLEVTTRMDQPYHSYTFRNIQQKITKKAK